MSFNLVSSLSKISFTNTLKTNTVVSPAQNTAISPAFKADSVSISTATTPPLKDPNNPPPPPSDTKTPFFDRAGVRVAGMMIGSAAVFGLAGAGIGSLLGSVGVGAAIGAGVGLLAPIGMLAYALYNWK
jgi:hypothetical protein